MSSISIAIADLHPAYAMATPEEAIQIANIGAVCWSTFKENLYSQWLETVTMEEATKAVRYRDEGRQEGLQMAAQQLNAATAQGRREAHQEMEATVAQLRAALDAEQGRSKTTEATVSQLRTALDAEQAKVEGYRAEGRAALLESLREQLASTETLHVRLAVAEGRETQLRRTMDEEVARRVQTQLEGVRTECEMARLCEMRDLQVRVAAANASEEMVALVKEAQRTMREKLVSLEEQRETLRTELAAATATRSSSAIGRSGETTVFEMLVEILDVLPHSELKDMTKTGHSADFHVWIMAATGRRAKILVDSKKYKRAVDRAEILKLNEDVDADADAHCGLMVSLDSAISSTKQFQLGRTAKQKPILYMSFRDIPSEMQKEALSWGLRVLTSLVGERDDATRMAMFDVIESFVAGVEQSVKEMDVSIAQALKGVDGLRRVRVGLVGQLVSFKSGKVTEATTMATTQVPVQVPVPDSTDTPTQIPTSDTPDTPDTQALTCNSVYKSTGKVCEMPVIPGQTKCNTHMRRRRLEK